MGAETQLILDAIHGLESRITRRLDDHEARMRAVEDLHARERGGRATLAGLLAAAGASGGIAGAALALVKGWLAQKIARGT